MKKLFDILLKLIFWLAIFGSPFLACFAIAIIIYSSHENLKLLSITIVIIGFISGTFLAEKIRKKYGCSNFISRIFY
jgi:hypothetical protein